MAVSHVLKGGYAIFEIASIFIRKAAMAVIAANSSCTLLEVSV
jgi:hypothetical protein